MTKKKIGDEKKRQKLQWFRKISNRNSVQINVNKRMDNRS